jgi:photosystem II stability/assembly factor-like uncharacterized protein
MKSCTILFITAFFLGGSAFGQFQLCNSGTTQNLNDVHFLDQDRGFAVGDSGTVLGTSNGGLDWTSLPVPLSDNFRQVDFFDDSVGLIIGNQLLRTADGGASWTLIGESDQAYYDLEILNGNTVLVSSPDIGLIRSQDQGQSWDTLVLFNPNGAIGLLSFVNDSLGYATRAGNPPNGKLLQTIDGGLNWTELLINSGSENSVVEAFQFLSPDTGFIGGWYNAYLAKTTNSGTDWAFTQNDDSLNEGQIYDFCFPAPGAYYACGWHNLILKSTDGGLNWFWIPPNVPLPQSFKGLFFLNDSLGWIVGTGGVILKTEVENAPLGVDSKEKLALGIQVFPNPARSQVSVVYPAGVLPLRIEVFQLEGKLVSTFSPQEAVWMAEPGMYFLQIHTSQGTVGKRVLIE